VQVFPFSQSACTMSVPKGGSAASGAVGASPPRPGWHRAPEALAEAPDTHAYARAQRAKLLAAGKSPPERFNQSPSHRSARSRSAARRAARAAAPAAVGSALLAMAVHTPPAHGAIPGTPILDEEPAFGCTLEELRAWTVSQFKHARGDATDLEVRTAGRLNVIASAADSALARTSLLETAVMEVTAKMKDIINDVGVFGVIKNYVTETSLEARMANVDMELKLLAAHGNEFVVRLDEHLVKVDGLEAEFKVHVGENFMKVEAECRRITTALEGISSSSSSSNINATVAQRVVAFEVNVAREMATINGNIATLKSGMDSIPLLIASSQGTAAATLLPGKCHCDHVDQLDGRVAILEVSLAATKHQDGWAGGADPWSTGRAAMGAAPMRSPPGYPGGGNGGGDKGGSGGGGAPMPRVAKVNEELPDMTGVNLSKLFDDKVAMSEDYRFDGVKGGDSWRKKVRGYFISKLPEMRPILLYSESMGHDVFTNEMLVAEASTCRWMTESNVERLSEVLWGFLNTCLKDKAKEEFEAAEELDGFDAWRRVVQHIWQGANVRQGLLRKAVKNPPAIKSLEDVSTGITRFEQIMKAYKDAGGVPPTGQELKNDFMDTLPEAFREQLFHRFTTVPDESFSNFVEHVRITAQSILFHKGKFSVPVNAVAAPQEEYGPEYPPCGSYDEEVLALNRRFGKGGGKGGGKGDRGSKGGGKGDRPLKCTNCGPCFLARLSRSSQSWRFVAVLGQGWLRSRTSRLPQSRTPSQRSRLAAARLARSRP
jgi:hypothetical protein